MEQQIEIEGLGQNIEICLKLEQQTEEVPGQALQQHAVIRRKQ